MSDTSSEFTFPALQGSSLLGFLAALGSFRTLSMLQETKDIRMRWIPAGGSYCPELRLPSPISQDEIIQKLYGKLHDFAGHYVIAENKDLKIPGGVFRKLATRAAEDFINHADKEAASMVAAFGCDAVENEEGMIEDTAFRTMSGAGHQHFLEFMNILSNETTEEQIREALFGPWRYRDLSPTMRWDAEDDRRYALRWDEPSKDPVRTVRGANLLAIAALPLFPVVPVCGNVIATTAFSGKGRHDTFVSWPIWSNWITLDTVRSLLSFRGLSIQNASLAEDYGRYGIIAAYKSQRITLGKYRNFTPASPL